MKEATKTGAAESTEAGSGRRFRDFAVAPDVLEAPLLRATLKYCDGNQSRAAEVLGLNRATLRKKLRHHKIKEQPSARA